MSRVNDSFAARCSAVTYFIGKLKRLLLLRRLVAWEGEGVLRGEAAPLSEGATAARLPSPPILGPRFCARN